MAKLLNELTVMSDVAEIMAPLRRDERRRVIEWLSDYFNVYGDEFVIAEDIEDAAETELPVVTIVTEEVIDVIKEIGALCVFGHVNAVSFRVPDSAIVVKQIKDGVAVARKKVSSVKLEA